MSEITGVIPSDRAFRMAWSTLLSVGVAPRSGLTVLERRLRMNHST
jgi:hypothetical protein